MKLVLILSLTVCSTFAIESNFYREESCAKSGGFCVLESECPHSIPASMKDLCSGQKSGGAVCCPNFPEKDLNCHQLHHSCMERCPKSLDRGKKGCADGKTCCTLV